MMKRLLTAAVISISTLISIDAVVSQESNEQTVQTMMELMPADTITNAEVFESNGFRISASQNKELGADFQPSGNQFESVMITAEDIIKVAIEKGRPMSKGGGVGIFHRTTGVPMMSIADETGDGRIDILSYSVIGDDGKAIREVVDYEADGQADLRVHFDESYTEIWHKDRWHRIEERNGQRGIFLDGEFKKVENIQNRLEVQ